MTSTIANALGIALGQARLAGQLINCTTLPSTEDEAYLIQQAIVDASDDTISGIKIGATNTKTQSILGLSQPFYGPIFSRDVFYRDVLSGDVDKHDVQVPLAAAYPVKVETEYVIGLKKSLTGTPGDVSMDEVMAAINWIAPGFELIGSRVNNAPEKPGLCAIADGGGNHNVIIGSPDNNWQGRDWQQQIVTLSINGNQVDNGHSGDSIAGSPISMLHWLVNFDRFAGQQLTAGQFVFCGTCTAPADIIAGDQLRADFGELGELCARCTDYNA